MKEQGRFKAVKAGVKLQAIADKKNPCDVLSIADGSVSDSEGVDAVEIGIEIGIKMGRQGKWCRVVEVDVGGQATAFFIGNQESVTRRISHF